MVDAQRYDVYLEEYHATTNPVVLASDYDVLAADLAEARAEIQNLGKRELDYKELYQVERAYLAEANQISDDFRNENATLQAYLAEARGLLRQVGGEDWHHDAGCSSNANSIDDCDCMPGMARALLVRTEGKA